MDIDKLVFDIGDILYNYNQNFNENDYLQVMNMLKTIKEHGKQTKKKRILKNIDLIILLIFFITLFMFVSIIELILIEKPIFKVKVLGKVFLCKKY